jgi:hypothetical protein
VLLPPAAPSSPASPASSGASAGTRAHAPFVAVNCGGVVATLAESLLFGHVRGAFTGADEDAPGAFRVAHEGTMPGRATSARQRPHDSCGKAVERHIFRPSTL